MAFTRPQLFFTTSPAPCPYKEDEVERKLVTELRPDQAIEQYDLMICAGFRRSHNFIYCPLYSRPDYCYSVRVNAKDFNRSRSQRRIWNRNKDLRATACPARATDEQYALFQDYVQSRHGDGDMRDMTFRDYRDMVNLTPIDTEIIEFRDEDGRLIAACLVDWVADGVSAVYSFFDIEQQTRGLGTFMVLWLIDEVRKRGLYHVYLGYLIPESHKMAYKARFQPLEAFIGGKWLPYPLQSGNTPTSG